MRFGNPYTSYINSTTFLNNESSISEQKIYGLGIRARH